jgi:hypothetical protein
VIDLPLYALSIPLTLVLLTSTILYDLGDYSQTISELELAVEAHKLADDLVNYELAESQEIVEGEIKTWPNRIDKINVQKVPEKYSVLITLGNQTLFSKGELSGTVYSVNRIVLYQEKSTILRISLSE